MERETYRVEAFSDGVFAFAITLLALDLKTPVLEGAQDGAALWHALRADWPAFLMFVSTFVSIFIMWVNHHAIFTRVRKVTPRLLAANGALMLLVVTTPFTTATMSRYLTTPAGSAAAALYAGSFVLVNLAYNWLFRAAVTCCEAGSIAHLGRSYRLAFPVYVAATAVAYVSPYASIALCAALWLVWAAHAKEI